MRKIRIVNDVMGIVRRLKNIDRDYFVVWNKKNDRYEIHNCRCEPTLVLVLPYPQLDSRAITYVQSTRIENMQEFIVQMDEYNHKLEESKNRQILDESSYKSKHLIDFIATKGEAQLPSYNEI